MTKKRKLSIVDLLQTILGFIGGAILTFITIQHTHCLAKLSGQLDKPKAQLYIYDYLLAQNEIYNLTYGFSFDNSSVVISRIPLVIGNDGEKTLEDLILTIRYPEGSRLALEEDLLKMDYAGELFPEKPVRSVSHIVPYDFVTYSISRIHPGQNFEIQEPLPLRKTQFEGDIQLEDYSINLEYSFEAYYRILISIKAKNLRAQDYFINLRAISSSDMDDLFFNFVKGIELKAKERRKQTSFFNYLSLLFKDTREQIIFTCLCTLLKHLLYIVD